MKFWLGRVLPAARSLRPWGVMFWGRFFVRSLFSAGSYGLGNFLGPIGHEAIAKTVIIYGFAGQFLVKFGLVLFA